MSALGLRSAGVSPDSMPAARALSMEDTACGTQLSLAGHSCQAHSLSPDVSTVNGRHIL